MIPTHHPSTVRPMLGFFSDQFNAAPSEYVITALIPLESVAVPPAVMAESVPYAEFAAKAVTALRGTNPINIAKLNNTAKTLSPSEFLVFTISPISFLIVVIMHILFGMRSFCIKVMGNVIVYLSIQNAMHTESKAKKC